MPRTTIEEYNRRAASEPCVKEAMAKIEELTGIKRSENRGSFLKEELEPRLDEARGGQRAVFFVDAAHFVLAPFLGILWCFTRLFIKAPAGRKRFNVLGALNAATHELVTVTNDTYINSSRVFVIYCGVFLVLTLESLSPLFWITPGIRSVNLFGS